MLENELDLLRGIFNLHKKEISWGLVKETSSSDTTYKPGLYIKDSRVYVDLFARRLFSPVKLDFIERSIYEAKVEVVDDEHIVFVAKDDADKYIVLGKSFVSDIYGVTIYGEWMEEQVLL